MAQLRTEPIPDRPDADYLRSIHKRMFERIVPGIAGRIRDVNVQAGDGLMAYCRPQFIESSMDDLFRKLEREDHLTGFDSRMFADRLGDRWGELTNIHPYRDGDTAARASTRPRSQSEPATRSPGSG